LNVKFSSIELKYEAETAIHAKDWVNIIAKYNTNEIPLNNVQNNVIIPCVMPVPKIPLPEVPQDVEIQRSSSDIQIKSFIPVLPGCKKTNENLINEFRGKFIKSNTIQSDDPCKKPIIPPRSLLSARNQPDDIPHYIELITTGDRDQNNDRSDKEDYMNTGIIDIISNKDSIYLCLYDIDGVDYELTLKRGSIVQFVEKVSDDFFIARFSEEKKKSSIGLVSFINVVKIYTKNS
jgi:hypothetical protein